MSLSHGHKTVTILDGVDLSQYVKTSEFTRSVDNHDVTTYHATRKAHVYAPGLRDGKGTLSGNYDTTAGTGPRAVINDIIDGEVAVELIRRPEGTGAGLPQDLVDVVLSNYVETSPAADYVGWSVELQLAGDVDTTPQV